MIKLKVKLTEQGLWINSYKCKSVTIYQKPTEYVATLFHIKGYTKKEPKLSKLGVQETDFNGNPLFYIKKLKKKITSKELVFEGIEPKPTQHNNLYLHSKNTKGNYINYYLMGVKPNSSHD